MKTTQMNLSVNTLTILIIAIFFLLIVLLTIFKYTN